MLRRSLAPRRALTLNLKIRADSEAGLHLALFNLLAGMKGGEILDLPLTMSRAEFDLDADLKRKAA